MASILEVDQLRKLRALILLKKIGFVLRKAIDYLQSDIGKDNRYSTINIALSIRYSDLSFPDASAAMEIARFTCKLEHHELDKILIELKPFNPTLGIRRSMSESLPIGRIPDVYL